MRNWKNKKNISGHHVIYSENPKGEIGLIYGFNPSVDAANAEFICTAVNNHDKLIETLQKLTDESMASDFNEHWDSYKEAKALLQSLTQSK